VTGLTFDWDGIGYVTDTAAIDFVKLVSSKDYAPETAIEPGIQYIKEKKPTFMTIYIGGLDETGHGEGWGSDAYYAMLERIDACIGKVVQAVKDAGIYNETIFIISADHGGINKGHGGMTLEELQTPFIVCGKNVKSNYQMKEGMMQFDTAATIAYIFGLKRPSCWIGRPMAEIFR
jgi:predicted AlkP superfamily pyrophosphatase or phosphodiesterase